MRWKQQRTARALTARAHADLRILRATDEAEARGDARGAAQLINEDLRCRKDANFWRPERIGRLLQLSLLSSYLPRWATSRWTLSQAAQWLDEDNRHRTMEAFAVAFAAGGFDPDTYADPVDLRTKILDHNWVFRQCFLYDLGGLRHFLDSVASADLVVGADRIRDWADTPLGGYRLLRETPRTLTWFDLAAGEEVATANLGAATLLEPDDFAVGRLVPVEGGSMFESAPLLVPEQVAQRVADDPAAWVSAVADVGHGDGDGGREVITGGHDFELLTDVPRIVQHLCMLAVERDVYGHTFDAANVDVRAVQVRLVRAAMDGRVGDRLVDISPWPTVAATVLNPFVVAGLLSAPCPGDGEALNRLAARLAEPAATVCRALAAAMETGAADVIDTPSPCGEATQGGVCEQ